MLTVRSITALEWQKYREIRLRALKESPEAFGSTWDAEVLRPDETWSARTQESALGQTGRGFFALDGALPCGIVWCLLSDLEPDTAHIYGMWVDPALRGQGVGRALLAECIAWAKRKEAHCIRLGVTVADSPAMHMYQSQGFGPVGDPELLRPGSTLMAQAMALKI